MYLENLVVDATDPRALGRFWESALGTTTLSDEPEGYETRLTVRDGPVLDLCFQPVPEPPAGPPRLHLDLRGGDEQPQVVQRLLDLGACRAGAGQDGVPWLVLADPEGNPFCVVEERATHGERGPIAALTLDAADPGRDRSFWSWLTGWVPAPDGTVPALRHPSGRGPLLRLRPERLAKRAGKNRMHLDVRLEPGDDVGVVTAEILRRGGRALEHPEWGELPWRFFTDPSGNDFCVLPARGQV